MTRLVITDFFDGNDGKKTIAEIEKIMVKLPWKQGNYVKQSWKNWLHSISPYVGRITPAFAHWLIKLFTAKEDLVLDPFCGVGTIPLEADLMNRRSIGVDLNPYACAISMAKFDRSPLKERLDWIKNVDLNTDQVDLEQLDPFIHQFYHQDTLREIIAIRNEMVKDNQHFLLGCLLGIAHGHRPQHLSAVTGYIIPYVKKDMKPEYKNVKEKLIQKVKRMYKDGFPLKTKGKIIIGDIRTVNIPFEPVDIIITSPPYYETLDYVDANRLRLAIMGYPLEKQKSMAEELIQHKDTYIDEMRVVGNRLRQILKPGGLCIYVLGDVIRGQKRINTAKDVSECYKEIGYETLFCIEDKIPKNKATIGKFAGEEVIKDKPEKSDRILVMRVDGS